MTRPPPNVLLVNPWIYDFAAYDLWSQPLGLLYIGAFLHQRGCVVRYIDCLAHDGNGKKRRRYGTGNYHREIVEKPAVLNHIPRHYARYGIPEEDFISQLKTVPSPDAVLLTSMMTYWYPGPKRVAELIRQIHPGVPLILGGIYATLMPDHARREIEPDHLVTGPGEIKVLQLLAEITGRRIKTNDLPQKIDQYPYPAFNLIKDPGYLIVMTARGCPYDCSFCAQKQIAMRFAQRDPEQVVAEITDHYRQFRLRDFAFYDDALFVNRDKHIKVILKMILETRLNLRFHSPNGLFARFIDAELANLMYKSGFKTIRLSFETSNEKRRKDMYNKISNSGMQAAVENLVRAGYKASDLEAYIIMGLPGQELDEIMESMFFINRLGLRIRLASFSPIPGTVEFRRAVESGRIAPDIDPLLTNKSIFPLSDSRIDYETFRKVRIFSHMLNDAASKGFSPFSDSKITAALKSVLTGTG